MSSALNLIIARGFSGTGASDIGNAMRGEQDRQMARDSEQLNQAAAVFNQQQAQRKAEQQTRDQAMLDSSRSAFEPILSRIGALEPRLIAMQQSGQMDPALIAEAQALDSELKRTALSAQAKLAPQSVAKMLIPKPAEQKAQPQILSGKQAKETFGIEAPEDSAWQFDPQGGLKRLQAGTTPMARASAEAASATRASADSARQQALDLQRTGLFNSLSDDLRAESKDFLSVKDAYGRILASAKEPSAAGDVALIFSYMKMLDPGSVIRESEYATAANAGAVPDRVRAAYNKAISGESLAPNMRSDFTKRAKLLYAQQRADQKKRNERYSARAKQAGIDPANLEIPVDPAEVEGRGGKSVEQMSDAEVLRALGGE